MSDKIDIEKKLPHQIEEYGRKLPDFGSVRSLVKGVESINPLSDKAKSTIVKSTQTTIADIHKSTVEYAAGMTVRNAEAIASIGVAHESKASEAIQAIERMNESALKAKLQESKNSKKGAFGAALLAAGALGGVFTAIQKFRK